MANDLTADEYLDATKTVSLITELVMLDKFWTDEAKAATSGDPAARQPDRVQGLETVVAEIDRLLVEVEQQAHRIVAVGRRRSARLEDNYKALTGDASPLTPGQREKLVEVVNTRAQGDLSAFVDAVAADVAALEPERKLLKDELDRIKRGGSSGGDFSAEGEQALAGVAVVASLVFGPEAGVVVEAVGHLLGWLFG